MTVATVALLEAVRDVSAGNTKIPQSSFLRAGPLAIVDQGQGLVAGYTDDVSAAVSTQPPVIVFGDHTRAIKYVDFPFAMGADGVKVLQVRDGFDARYVYHFLRSAHVPNAGYSRHFKFLKELKVPRLAVDEQCRIAAILDQAAALSAKRRQMMAHLDALGQAILYDMFGDLDQAAETIRFGDVARLTGGRSIVADDASVESDYRVLKISAVTTGHFRPLETKPLPPGYTPPQTHLVRAGDLLMSRANTSDLVGAVAFVDAVAPNVALPDKIWRFEWLDESSEPLFYHALFRTPTIRRKVRRLASGTGGSMKNVSKSKLEILPLPRVPASRQSAFALRLAALNAERARLHRLLAMDDALFASLQSRAFSAEL